MRLTTRLLLGALAIVGVNVVVMALIVNYQLSGRLRDQAVDALTRNARSVAAQWELGGDAHALARAHGAALGHRVTVIRPDGVVSGDSEFDRDGLALLDNHSTRPEVLAARATGVGVATRTSPSRGDDELNVAVATRSGTVRVSMPVSELSRRVRSARGAVVIAGLVALMVALVVAGALARRIVRPLAELSGVARAIATGDLTSRAEIDAPGEVGELSLSLGDLSAQLAARAAARDAYEALLVQLIEALNEGVVGVNERRSVVRVNETARRLLGVVEPIPFSTDVLPRDRVLRDALDASLAGAVTEEVETELRGFRLAISARPLPGGGAVLALLDLTRLRRLEAVRRDFVANVSHELRTPLTVIGGFAETLTQPDLAAADRLQFAAKILTNTRRMQHIVDDLLDLSRIESGGWVPNPVDADVESVAADALSAARDVADRKGLELQVQIHPGARTVWADPTALRQIIGNLLDNSVRHTATGLVTVFTEPLDGRGTTVGVRDTGVGIAPDHVPRIFERFYRVDTARARDDGGTGLGLAIVKHLVEAHGGNVRAESIVGEGTTILARFPARLG